MVGRIEISERGTEVKLPIEPMREGERIIIYTHALEVCGYGKTEDEAKKDFEAAVKIFFEEAREHGTLDEALEALGWKKVELPPKELPPKEHWDSQVDYLNAPSEEFLIPA